jgi:cyclopropane-fatty-acyl-phospholipid synthase
MDGLWECDDLVALTRIAALNVRALDNLRRVLAPVLIPVQRWGRWLRATHRALAQAHRRPLRPRQRAVLAVSRPDDDVLVRVFDSPAATLEEASLAKLELVCAKLDLAPEDHLLEIGTGWGGLAVYAAERYGCRVTTTTISREQHDYASERVREAGLSGPGDGAARGLPRTERPLRQARVDRDDRGRRLAVLPDVLPPLLGAAADDGAMLLQAIVIDDRAYHVEKAGKSFINTYIFPGGCLPSLEIISRSVARVTDFRQVHLEDITAHYATTLERWRERFLDAGERLSELGYDERFRRLWELYLSYCEGGFRERRIQDVQLLLAKPGYRGRLRRAEPRPDLVAA